MESSALGSSFETLLPCEPTAACALAQGDEPAGRMRQVCASLRVRVCVRARVHVCVYVCARARVYACARA